jgi:hypothetical protein
MDQKEVFKQMVEFNKKAFDNAFNAMVMIQEQNEKMLQTMLGQASWMPEDGKKVINTWLDTYKQGRDDYKKLVEENFRKVDEFFGGKSE